MTIAGAVRTGVRKLFHLSDVDVDEISFVDRPANRKRFAIVKRAGGARVGNLDALIRARRTSHEVLVGQVVERTGGNDADRLRIDRALRGTDESARLTDRELAELAELLHVPVEAIRLRESGPGETSTQKSSGIVAVVKSLLRRELSPEQAAKAAARIRAAEAEISKLHREDLAKRAAPLMAKGWPVADPASASLDEVRASVQDRKSVV